MELHVSLCAVPPPRIIVTRDHSQETHYTGSSLTLTCTIRVDPAVDTPVIVNNQWIGHGERVIMTQLEGKHPVYDSVVKFKSLKSEDAGDYACLANVSSLNESPLLPSTRSQSDITLKIGNVMKCVL